MYHIVKYLRYVNILIYLKTLIVFRGSCKRPQKSLSFSQCRRHYGRLIEYYVARFDRKSSVVSQYLYFPFLFSWKLLVLWKLPSDFRHQRVNTQSETKDLCSGLVIFIGRSDQASHSSISLHCRNFSQNILLKGFLFVNPSLWFDNLEVCTHPGALVDSECVGGARVVEEECCGIDSCTDVH